MSDNIEESVISKIQKSLFALQIDKSTEISNYAQLIAFKRIIDEETIINQFLYCKQIPTTTEGQDIFDTITIWLILGFMCGNIYRWSSINGCIKGCASLRTI